MVIEVLVLFFEQELGKTRTQTTGKGKGKQTREELGVNIDDSE